MKRGKDEKTNGTFKQDKPSREAWTTICRSIYVVRSNWCRFMGGISMCFVSVCCDMAK